MMKCAFPFFVTCSIILVKFAVVGRQLETSIQDKALQRQGHDNHQHTTITSDVIDGHDSILEAPTYMIERDFEKAGHAERHSGQSLNETISKLLYDNETITGDFMNSTNYYPYGKGKGKGNSYKSKGPSYHYESKGKGHSKGHSSYPSKGVKSLKGKGKGKCKDQKTKTSKGKGTQISTKGKGKGKQMGRYDECFDISNCDSYANIW